MQKAVTSTVLKQMFLAGGKVLDDNKEFIDSLNVFPVPDGDTGTNMSLTYTSAIKEVNTCFENTFECFANALSRGALKGARGNSGVILSQIFKGMSQVFEKAEGEVTTKLFAKAIANGSHVAYKAVTKPREGTILTVIRVMGESAEKLSKKHSDVAEFLRLVIEEGEKILQKTPDMLPVLKKAGVVDAGGRGLLVIFTGMYMALANENDIVLNAQNLDNKGTAGVYDDNHSHDGLVNYENLDEIEFAYCTEFMISHMKENINDQSIDILRDKLVLLGDSVVCVGDTSLIKVHIHTNQPDIAIGYALELGEIVNLKVDNMVEQNRQLKSEKELEVEDLKEIGMVAVAPGVGIAQLFTDILVDNIVSGGQTMNPSAQDIAIACDTVKAKNVIVFPNNKNIILAAEQAKELTKRNIHIVPTRSIPEGMASILSFNSEEGIDKNLQEMALSKDSVISASVTYAVRDTHLDGFDLLKGDIIGLDENNIISKGENINETTINLIEKLMNDDITTITLFAGSDVSEEEYNALNDELTAIYPMHDIIIMDGKQPVYYYIISLN